MFAEQKHNFVFPKFAQMVVGPPGSGKTTYCHKMCEFLTKLERNVCVINLDPANENMCYKPAVDIMELITVEDVMEHSDLGPNGALVYCFEYLEENIGWLLDKLKLLQNSYFIFDCPGQLELYTHHKSVSRIFAKFESLNFHLCTVQLIDSHYCSDPPKFISTLLMALNSMLMIGLPHINVLSKADLLKQFESKLLFNVDFYTDVLDLSYLVEAIDNTTAMSRYRKLNKAIVSMVEDFSLVKFHLLDVNLNESLLRLKNLIDKTNGYVYGAGEERSVNSLLACAIGAETEKTRIESDIEPYLSK